MKSLQISEPGKIEIIDMPVPEPGPLEVLLKIEYVGFCGSDLSTYLGKNPMVSYPRIPGHEVAATIEKTGGDVPKEYKPGLKATVIPYTNCGSCASCKNGRFNACRYNETLGVQRDGAMSDFLVTPWQKVLIDNDLTYEELALVEPLTVGFHAVDRGRVSKNELVMVLGCGMIGMGAIIGALVRKSIVIAVDVDENKLELAKSLGAQHTINSKLEDLSEALNKFGFHNGPDVIIEAVGNSITYKLAIDTVAFSGRVVCIGYTKEDTLMPTKLWVQKELDIMGSRNATPEDFRNVIRFLKKGELQVNKIITRIVDSHNVTEVVKNWADNPAPVIKILFNPSN